jgi:hypothetical protein
MRISKLMVIAVCLILVLAAAVVFSFDVFKAYAILGFILAVDTQIVMVVKTIREEAQTQALLDALKKVGDENEHKDT